MNGTRHSPLPLRIWLICTLVAVGVATAFVAQQERAASLALESGDLAEAAILPGQLRIALVLLVIAICASGYLVFATARRAADEPVDEGCPPQLDAGQPTESEATPLLSAEAGKMIAAGGLVRRFCHELANTLNPIQGYAELLIGDERLSDLHRRHVAKIAQSAAAALRDVQSIGMALNWSTRRGSAVQLDDAVAAAHAVAQSAIGARMSVAVMPGGDVHLTASEAEIGQAILLACAALGQLLAERDMQIDVKVDSFVGQSAPGGDDMAGGTRRLEIWSDPFEPARTKVQYGALQPSWRYGRVRIDCAGHGWAPEPAGRLFISELPEDEVDGLFMTILGRLILSLGGAISVDTQPLHHVHIDMYWPARIGLRVAEPLEIDAAEDNLDALIVDRGEAASEALSRQLTEFGLRVASTTSADTALELLGEMGPRCRAVLIGLDIDSAFAGKVRQVAPDCDLMFVASAPGDPVGAASIWPIDPDRETLQRLVARLHQAGG